MDLLPPNLTGRIDVHSHLLPGVDDGCANVEDSVACARLFVEAGYSHVICTPHIWPNLSKNTTENIATWAAQLQHELALRQVPLTLSHGGELNLTPHYTQTPADSMVTYGGHGKYCLFDIWADRLPPHFESGVKWLQSLGLTVIMAHPERLKAVQDDPGLVEYFVELGLLLQGNLYCLIESDLSPRIATRTAERFLRDGRYFILGSDCHKSATLPVRFAGLRRAIDIVGREAIDTLTMANPRKLLCS